MKKISWDTWEFAFLEEAYRQKYSLKEIAAFLERTLAAVNKVLIRHHIREKYQAERKTTEISFVKNKTLKAIQEELRAKGYVIPLRTSSILLKEKEAKTPDISWLLRSEIVFEPGEEVKQISLKKHKKNSSSKKSEIFHFQTIDVVLEWVQEQGFTVRKIPDNQVLPYQRSGHSGPWFEIYIPFLFKKSPRLLKSQSQLLLLVNKMRLKKALPPYYLCNVTEY